jgi:hypothetical protein
LSKGALPHHVDEDDVIHANLSDHELAHVDVVAIGHEVGGILVDVVHTIKQHHTITCLYHGFGTTLGSGMSKNKKNKTDKILLTYICFTLFHILTPSLLSYKGNGSALNRCENKNKNLFSVIEGSYMYYHHPSPPPRTHKQRSSKY